MRTSVASVSALLFGLVLLGCGDDLDGGSPSQGTDTDVGASTAAVASSGGSTGGTVLGSSSGGDPTEPTDPTDPSSTDTEDTGTDPPMDDVILRTGDDLDGAELQGIYSWGIDDDGFVRARVGYFDAGALQGDALVEASGDGTVDVLATPMDISVETGAETLNSTLHDADGFIAAEDALGCIRTFDFGFGSSLCPNDTQIDPDGVPFLRGLAEGTALVEVQRDVGIQFEVVGVNISDPLTVFLRDADTTPGLALASVTSLASVAINGDGAAISVAGRTPTANASAGIVLSNGDTRVVISDVGTGTTTSGTFPGDTLGNNILLASGQLFRGVTYNTPFTAFAFVPTDQNGNLAPTAGIYSYAADDKGFVRHLDLSAALFDGVAESPVVVEGTSPAFPLISFGITNDRRIIMVAELENGSVGVFREREPEVFINIATNRMMPGDDEGLFLEGATYADIGSVVMGEDGSLMFTARIEGDGIDAFTGLGVWGHGPGNSKVAPRLLARLGDPLPGDDPKATIERIQIADGIVVPDASGSMGLARRRTVPGVSNDLQIFGSSGSSQVVQPSECPRGLVHLQGATTEVLVAKRVQPSCD